MMKINQKLLSIAFLGVILGLASCNDDDSGGNLSKDQAKTELNKFNSEAVTDLQELSNADGLSAVKDLLNLVDTDDPFSRIGTDKKSIKTFFREKGKDFKTIIIPKSFNGRVHEDAYDYASKKGIYTWNPSNGVFEKTGESSIISILFPTENSETNNAELKITAYTEMEFYDEDIEESYYNPVILKASLLVDATEVASIDYHIEWSEDGFPTSADVTVFVTPFTASISFSGTATTSSLSTSLKKGSKVIIATSVTVKYDNETKDGESLNKIEGYVQFQSLKVQGSIDVKAADASQSGDPNDYIHLSLYADGKKVGNIVFVSETVDDFEEYVAYIEYNDGSKAKLADELKPVLDEIEALFN
jgi:hypothetical protein